ncbi:MAG: hypothetical protein KGO52_14175, partial [Nitrospirota bacterium]|nr:hypothetical protein [Nitrospirota bacterium]
MTRGLLALWLFFGCVELAEQLHFVPEASDANPAAPDMDQEALTQLASGLKSDVPSLSSPGCAARATLATSPCSSL